MPEMDRHTGQRASREGILRDLLIIFDVYFYQKLTHKLAMITLTFAVGSVIGMKLCKGFIINLILFYLLYRVIYFYNDYIDLERDKKKRVKYTKPLADGLISEKFFVAFAFNYTLLIVFLATIVDKLLTLLTLLCILFNNFRTHIRNVTIRQILLVLVEFLNFEAIWYALFGTLIPLLLAPLFVVISIAYSLSHTLYKKEYRSLKELYYDLKKNQKYVLILIVLSLISSIPAVFLSFFNFAILFLAILLYILVFCGVVVKKYKGLDIFYKEIRYYNLLTLGLTFITFFVSVLIYFNIIPLNAHSKLILEVKKYLSPYYTNLEYLDRLQTEIIKRIFGYK